MYKLIEENKDWLVIEKPAGLTVHAGAGIKEKTLIDFLLEDYPEIASAGDDFGNELVAKLEKHQVDMRQTAIDKGDALRAMLANQASQDK